MITDELLDNSLLPNRPAANPKRSSSGARGGFSSLVVSTLQLFHPLVGKQLSSAICQSANRGQIRGLLVEL